MTIDSSTDERVDGYGIPQPTTAAAPEYGQFLPRRELAEALAHHLPALRKEREWCSDLRAEPRIVQAIYQIETAIDILRTERHY